MHTIRDYEAAKIEMEVRMKTSPDDKELFKILERTCEDIASEMIYQGGEEKEYVVNEYQEMIDRYLGLYGDSCEDSMDELCEREIGKAAAFLLINGISVKSMFR